METREELQEAVTQATEAVEDWAGARGTLQQAFFSCLAAGDGPKNAAISARNACENFQKMWKEECEKLHAEGTKAVEALEAFEEAEAQEAIEVRRSEAVAKERAVEAATEAAAAAEAPEPFKISGPDARNTAPVDAEESGDDEDDEDENSDRPF